jgi:UDP-N-acetylglucosamine--N-acetylmuramyl-(pentapeptide) pyrophosphoryl-undecaprenol N-acetylglucosamine transferase
MRVVIAGGGTGGHLFPGIAVAREFMKSVENAEVTFIGTTRGIESRIIPKEGFDIRFIRSEGLVGKGLAGTLRSVMKIPLSLKDSYGILRELEPDLAFGVGGYSSGPVLLSAMMMGIPTMIHEQNTVPGLTNRLLGKVVRRVAATYHESIASFPKGKTFLTGNPVREEILNGDRERGYERALSLWNYCLLAVAKPGKIDSLGDPGGHVAKQSRLRLALGYMENGFSLKEYWFKSFY